MKIKIFRLLTTLLVAAMFIILCPQVQAAQSNTETMDTVIIAETATETQNELSTDITDVEETGYYLVWEDFTNPTPNTYSSNIPSSWDAQAPAGGLTFVTTDEIKIGSLVDKSKYADAILLRQFNSISGKIVWEFTLNATGDVEDAVVVLASGETTAIKFTIVNGNLTANGQAIAAVPDGTELVGIKVELDTETDTYTVRVDGITLQEVFVFEEDCDSVDRMYLQTTKENEGTLGLGLVRVYTNLYVNEKFLTSTEDLPDDWTWNEEGSVNVIRKMGSVSPDLYNLEVTDIGVDKQTVISKEVTYKDDEAWLEYQFLIPEGSNAELGMVLQSEDGETFKVGNITSNGNNQFGYYDENGVFVALYDMIDEQWYHVLVKVTRNGPLIYLNHKLQADGIDMSFVKFDTISFETSMTGTGTILLDDILLKDYVDYPQDYVPEPELPEEDDYIVGLQSCSLWKEGSHFGWDWISDWDERHTYLGFYDEMSPEAADWAIKWQLEHSVDYELYCWYRPPEGAGEPIKQPRNAYALEEAFFNAKYSNQAKFAIAWENSSVGDMDSQDFRENIVSYWIEQYFKDDRYMLIDNKPVLGLYKFSTLLSNFGSVDGVKVELDYLRQACREAGFDGCVIMLVAQEAAASSLQQYKDAGIDCLYAYSWGGNAENQKEKMVAQRDIGIMDILPTICMGRDDSAWERNSGYFLTDEEFRGLAEWAKNTYMVSAEEGSLSSRMVMLGNWNEFGEGHFMMPAEVNGFGYLDSVRAVFGDNVSHTDIQPTATQLTRINKMYIQDRRIPRAYKEEFDEEIPTQVKHGWYFETAGNTEGWTSGGQITNLQVSDGAITGTTNGNDPKIYSMDNLNIVIGDVSYIKVRMKVQTGSVPNFSLYFRTEESPNWSQAQCLSASLVDSEEYVDVFLHAEENQLWNGTLQQLRLDPVDGNGTFAIDSIELLQKESYSDVKVLFEGEEAFTSRQILIRDGQIMFPAAELGDYVSASWCDSLDKSSLLMLIGEKSYIDIKYDNAEATVNGEAFIVPLGAITIDDQAYFPLKEVMEAAGFYVEWNENEGIVNITNTGRVLEVKKGWYFDSDSEGWAGGGSVTVFTWDESGALKLSPVASAAPYTWSPQNLGIDMSEISQIRIRVKSEAPVETDSMRLYFTSDDSLSMTKSFYANYTSAKPEDDGYYTFTINTTKNSAWSGVLSRMRFDPTANAAVCYIDSVELIGEKKEEEPPVVEELEVTKGWYFDADVEGWQGGGSATAFAWDESGALKLSAANGNPYTWSPEGLGIDISDVKKIRVRVKAENPVGGIRVFFSTLEDTSVNYAKSYYAEYQGMNLDSDGYYTIEYDCTDILSWKGILYRFNIHPTAGGTGEYYIDSIELLASKASFEEPQEPDLGADLEAKIGWYFDENQENWVGGGVTSFIWDESGALKLSSANATPYCWSGDNLGIDISDVTYIRVRVKSENAAGIFSLYFTTAADTVLNETKKFMVAYDGVNADEDGYYTFYFECAANTSWTGTLNRLRIAPTASSTAEYYIDSVELLKEKELSCDMPMKILVIGNSITQHAPDSSKGWLGDWGMASTSAENDYVHRLQAKVLSINPSATMKWVNISEFEKYFYDFSKVTLDYSEYVDFNADIIICTIGANVKNAEPEEDGSYADTEQVFTAKHYKDIIDYFNPNKDAKVIVGTTIWVGGEIETAIKAAANEYGYDFVSMNDLTDSKYRAYAYAEQLKATFNVTEISSGVLAHPGDEGMRVIAERLWDSLKPTMVEFFTENGGSLDEEEPETPDQPHQPEQPEEPEEPEEPEQPDIPESGEGLEVRQGWYFDENAEGWVAGGSTGLIWNETGTLSISAGTTNPYIWSPDSLGTDLTGVTQMRIRIKADAPVNGLRVYFNTEADQSTNFGKSFWVYYEGLTAGTDGYYTIDINCSENASWTGTLKRMRIDPTTAVDGVIYYIDSVELVGAKTE